MHYEPAQIQKMVEGCSNLAGNAFCLYQLAPLELALYATYGRFSDPAMASTYPDMQNADVPVVLSSGSACLQPRQDVQDLSAPANDHVTSLGWIIFVKRVAALRIRRQQRI